MKQTLMSYLRILGVGTALSAIIGAVVWILGLLLGWKTPVEYSNALFIAGAIALAVGILSVIGGYQLRGDFRLLYPQSAGVMDLKEQTASNVSEINRAYGTLLLLTVPGILLIVASILIDRIF